MNSSGGRRPPHNLYARTLTRHALLQSSLSHPQPRSEHLPPNLTRSDQYGVARRDHLLPDVVTRCDQPRPIQRAPPFLSRSSNSLDILPPRHRPLFASGASSTGLHGLSASVLNLNDALPDGAFAHYEYYHRQQREPVGSGLRRRCDSTSALARLKPKRERDGGGCNNSEWGRKLSK